MPKDLIVDVDPNDGVGTHLSGASGHFIHGLRAGLDQFIFIGAGTAADDVADAGREVPDEIYAGDDFSENDALVFSDGASSIVGVVVSIMIP